MNTFWRQVRATVVVLTVLTVLTGFVFPLAMLAVAQALFPDQANGSLVERNGATVGSTLLGQSFVDDAGQTLPGYFRGRPSAAGEGYDASLSGGSNLGPLNPALPERVAADVAIIRAENGLDAAAPIPVDLVTASGSGLDPHISPASAALQVTRVAEQRGISPETVAGLVEEHTERRTLGVIGEPRVNVLELNVALDDLERTVEAES